MDSARPLTWCWLGRIGYEAAEALQRRIRDAVLAGAHPGALLLLEHPPVITLGRHANPAHIVVRRPELSRLGVTVHQTDRGGDVTYHGPGQLVAYPVMPVVGGVRGFVHALASAARTVLATYGVEATWDEERPGLWTRSGKIAAVGLRVSRGVATHGIAINVSPNLEHFRLIVPCGLQGAGVTSLAALTGSAPPVSELAEQYAAALLPEHFASRTPVSREALLRSLNAQ